MLNSNEQNRNIIPGDINNICQYLLLYITQPACLLELLLGSYSFPNK